MSNIDLLAYNRQGRVFMACNNATANHIAPNTTYTGFALYNPWGSGKALAIVHFGFSWVTGPAAVHNVGIAVSPSSPTALSGTGVTTISGPTSGLGQGATTVAVARVYDAATIPAAGTFVRWLGTGMTTASASQMLDYVDGSIILMPGAILTTGAKTTTMAGMASCCWIELDL